MLSKRKNPHSNEEEIPRKGLAIQPGVIIIPSNVRSSQGNVEIECGQVLMERYTLNSLLGKGTFGTVFAALDTKEQVEVAVKVIPSTIINCSRTARREIQMMWLLRGIDPHSKKWVKMLDHFILGQYICIVYERLGSDLLYFMKKNYGQPYPLHQVKHIAYQLLVAVKALHDNLTLHTDLKPANICFKDSSVNTSSYTNKLRKFYKQVKDSTISIIDFGLAKLITEICREGVIQTRSYRCPEVVFKLDWSYPADIFSIGCILYELYTGKVLFEVNTDEEHAKMFIAVLGPLPERFLNSELGYLISTEQGVDPSSERYKPLKKHIINQGAEHYRFIDFISKLLIIDPLERISIHRALKHSFVRSLPSNLKA